MLDIPLLTPLGGVSSLVADLNFASGQYVGGAITNLTSVTRASPATTYAMNSSGLLVPFAANVARVTNLGLLVENISQNILFPSNSPTTWTAVVTCSNSQNIADPAGTANSGWTVTQTGANGTDSRDQNNITVANDSASYCVYAFVKKQASAPAAYPVVQAAFSGGTTKQSGIVIDVVNGAATALNVSAGNVIVTSAGSYWLVSFTISNNGTGNATLTYSWYPAWNVAYSTTKSTVSGGSNGFAFGGVEPGVTVPSSYIPTVSAAVSRNADIVTLAGIADALIATGSFSLVANLSGSPSTNPGVLKDNSNADILSFNGTSSQNGIKAVIGAQTLTGSLGSGTIGAPVNFGFSVGSGSASLVGNKGTLVSGAATWSGSSPFTLLSGYNGFMTRLRLWHKVGDSVLANFT